MLERAILVIGGLIGLGSGLAFYHAVEHLRLPGMLYVIVDLFGVKAGSVVFGLFMAPVAVGALVLLVDRFFPSQKG